MIHLSVTNKWHWKEVHAGTCHTHTHTLRFNDHFSRWTWVSRLPP